MRIWSLHPKYLDTKGLLAVWRETLLAKNVLEGKTKGYKNHPQLVRFKNCENSLIAINRYLFFVHEESIRRNYKFDITKIDKNVINDYTPNPIIAVTTGQIIYEKEHLLSKLIVRDREKQTLLQNATPVELHPLFYPIEGDIESWEVI